MTKQIIYSLDEIDTVVHELAVLKNQCKIYTFTGPLGAGKTTLIKKLLARFGVTDVVTSPTFTYVVEYTDAQENNYYHFDLYRLNDLSQFLDAGFGEYLYAPKSWCFIEWPEIVMPLLTHNVCHSTIDYYEITKRILKYHCL